MHTHEKSSAAVAVIGIAPHIMPWRDCHSQPPCGQVAEQLQRTKPDLGTCIESYSHARERYSASRSAPPKLRLRTESVPGLAW